MPPAKPKEPSVYMAAASCHSPLPTQYKAAVPSAPSKVKKVSSRTRVPPRSAAAPNKGASAAITKPAMPLALPSRSVVTVASAPALQYLLKKTGKNPAITVQANAELAQSYIAHATTWRRRAEVMSLGSEPTSSVVAIGSFYTLRSRADMQI